MATQDIRIKVKADTVKATSSMQKFTKSIGGTKVAALAVAAALTAATVATAKMIQSVADAGDEFDKMSKRLDVSVETLSELKFAAERSGASLDDIEKAMKKVAKSAIDADRGLETYARTFRELGVNIRDAGGNIKDMDVLFRESMTAISALETNTERTTAALELFGRAGVNLAPLMKEGEEGIEALSQRLRDLGGVYSGELATASAALIDAQLDLTKAFEGLKIAISEEFMDDITEFFNASAEWVAAHRTDIVDTIDDLATAFSELYDQMVLVNKVWDSLKLQGVDTTGAFLTGAVPGEDVTALGVAAGIEGRQLGGDSTTGGPGLGAGGPGDGVSEGDFSLLNDEQMQALEEQLTLKNELEITKAGELLDSMQILNDLRTEGEQAQADREIQIQQDKTDAILNIEQMQAAGRIKMWSDAQAGAEIIGKKGFEVYKGIAIAQTTIDTFSAAMAAYRALSGIPYIGPALGAAAAAAAVAAGMARVDAIRSTTVGGGGSAGGGGGGGSVSVPSSTTSTPTVAQPSDIETPRNAQIHVEVHGNIVDHAAFVRELSTYIGEAEGDNVVFVEGNV